VLPAAYSFIYRLMANHTGSNPEEGVLDKATLKSFFGYSGPDDNLVHTPGTERIPENCLSHNNKISHTLRLLTFHAGYRRPLDDYGFAGAVADGLYFDTINPSFLSVGGNTGTVSSFTGVDIGNLTGGVYNAESLAQGNNAWCFAIQVQNAIAPDILGSLFSALDKPLALVKAVTDQATSALGCPQLQNVDDSQFNQFPGSTRLSSQGTY
jgi:hypothetical protein